MADEITEFTIEGLDKDQLFLYKNFLDKIPNITKEIAKDLAIGNIDKKEASQLIWGSTIKASSDVAGSKRTKNELAITEGKNLDNVSKGMDMAHEIFLKADLIQEKVELTDLTHDFDFRSSEAAEGKDEIIPGKPEKIKPNKELYKEFEVYLPYEVRLLLNGFNIDKGAPNSVRWKLQFSPEDHLFQIGNFRELMLKNFLSTEEFTYNDYLKNTNNFQVEMKNLVPFDQKILSWRVMPDLGGDGIWRSINDPGWTTEDTTAFMATTGLEMISTTAAYIFGSAAGFAWGKPVLSGSAAAGATRWFHEVANEMIGKYILDLPYAKDDKDIVFSNIPDGLIEFFGSAIIMKAQGALFKFLQDTKIKMKNKPIIDMVKEYDGPSVSVTKHINEATDILEKSYKISDEEASKYLATSIALQFPDLVMGYQSSVTKKGSKTLIKSLIQKENLTNSVESKILQKLVGMDLRTVADFKLLDDQLKILVNADEASKASILNLKNILLNKEINTLTGITSSSPNFKYINNFAFEMSQVTYRLNTALGTVDKSILSIIKANSKNPKYKIDLGNYLKKDMRTFNAILGTDAQKLINHILVKQPIRKNFQAGKLGDKEFKLKMAEWATKKSTLESMGIKTMKDTQKILKSYVKLFSGETGILTYQNANLLRNIVRDLESLAPEGIQQNFLRNFKGRISEAINESLYKTGNVPLKKLLMTQNKLIYLTQTSGVNEFARAFGYGVKEWSGTQTAASFRGHQTFIKFFDGPNSVANAKELGFLLENNPYWKINKQVAHNIRSATMEFYVEQVLKLEAMTHKEFISKYGKQMTSILGKNLSKKFLSSSNSAAKTFKKFQKDYSDEMGVVQKYLQLGDSLDKYTAENIGLRIMEKGNELNLAPLKAVLKGQEWKAVQRVIVDDMFKQSSLLSPITNELSYDGLKLALYLHKNQGILRKAFGDSFVSDHKILAKALIILQNNSAAIIKKLGKIDPVYDTLAQQTQSGGMMIDILYGPLNHRRLILNRLARLYDKFDIEDMTFAHVANYQVFIQNAKKNFMMGMYPKVLDAMSKGEKMKWADTVFKYQVGFDTLTSPATYGLGIGTQNLNEVDLLQKEIPFLNVHRDEVPGQPNVAEGVSKAWDMTKEVVDKDIWEPITAFVSKLIQNTKSTSESIKRPELLDVEKKLEEMSGVKKTKDSVWSDVKKGAEIAIPKWMRN